MSPRTIALLTLALPALLAGACHRDGRNGGGDLVGKAIEAAGEPGAPAPGVDGARDVVTIETEEGLYTATSGEDLPLPAQFPGDVVLPVDARVLTSMTLGPAVSVSLRSPRSLGLVFDEFRAAQLAAGWREDVALEQAPVQALGFHKDGRRLEANFVAEPGGGTTLAISLRPASD
ncbi:hypothetical protein [Arenimonas caeni]|uniref:hypothetical protein n=1 Tax=Arenimonas caeni TaxID=2058085 RepID=UPI002A371521|nr:hypothetical protein [Arenimonas caeni]MDY0020864.1 hypothetical protein [Arenimonas caeni]